MSTPMGKMMPHRLILLLTGGVPAFGNFGTLRERGAGSPATGPIGIARFVGNAKVGGTGVGVRFGETVACAHTGLLTELTSNVTAPLRARSLPLTTAPVVAVTDCKAKILPAKLELVPRVADEATCQKTL